MKNVLIVDDSATMRKIIRRLLRQSELSIENVFEAANGLEALEAIASNDDIELILSDVNMPEMNGLELVQAVRQTHSSKDIFIMMITTAGGDKIRDRALRAGANGYITKPFTPESVKEAVERLDS